MIPTIFSLALRDAGTKTKLASSLLIMTIVGGAVAPVIMGYIADTTGSMAIAFLISRIFSYLGEPDGVGDIVLAVMPADFCIFRMLF